MAKLSKKYADKLGGDFSHARASFLSGPQFKIEAIAGKNNGIGRG